MGTWLDAETVLRQAQDPAQRMRMPALERIDSTRPFVPESYTQLYYTPLYAGLGHEQRLRYNQLFGLRINEYIMMLEADLVERLLGPLRRYPQVARDPALVRCIDVMIAEERRHYACFLAFNRLCRPDLYREGERYFALLPWPTRALFAAVSLLSGWFGFALWYLMAIEESSATLARSMTDEPTTETLGALEPTFVALHREHLRDEARHIQVDGLLSDLCLAQAGPTTRAWNARLFKAFMRPVVKPTRAGAGVKVVRQLVRDLPELAAQEEALIAAVLGLHGNRAYQTSLFSRTLMPLTFGLFDRTAELADLGDAMVGYDRRA